MGYPQDLDEMSDEKLKEELLTRSSRRNAGYCDYCNRRGDTSPCNFPDRHKQAAEILKTMTTAKEQPLSDQEEDTLLDAGYCPNCRLPGSAEQCDNPNAHNAALEVWGNLELKKAAERKEDITPKEADQRIAALEALSRLERGLHADVANKQATLDMAKAALCDAPRSSGKAAIVGHLMAAVDIASRLIEVEKLNVTEGFPIPSEMDTANGTIRPDQGCCPRTGGGDERDTLCQRRDHITGDPILCEFFAGPAREKHSSELYSICKKAEVEILKGDPANGR